jgi:hypothetical protein
MRGLNFLSFFIGLVIAVGLGCGNSLQTPSDSGLGPGQTDAVGTDSFRTELTEQQEGLLNLDESGTEDDLADPADFPGEMETDSACLGEGAMFFEDEGLFCCDGLVALEYASKHQTLGCGHWASPEPHFYVNCGDGVCGIEENICMCPEDCSD